MADMRLFVLSDNAHASHIHFARYLIASRILPSGGTE